MIVFATLFASAGLVLGVLALLAFGYLVYSSKPPTQ